MTKIIPGVDSIDCLEAIEVYEGVRFAKTMSWLKTEVEGPTSPELNFRTHLTEA
ncbi:uncharacterized protein G2W53_013973 [Senna tora]|uniref:Uncharacterized protein n=1 Tax=Senna tora TaxID=362788 RepID=A0A834U2W6_9FABA|nr:uncharacterized protein G2W53_013973 [Senna tora]